VYRFYLPRYNNRDGRPFTIDARAPSIATRCHP